jgi:hypothetical protein
MFDSLQIPVDESKLDSVVGVRANKRVHKKIRTIDPIHCETVNKELLSAIEKRYGSKPRF